MNEREPLTPDDIDLLLSAELDGELDDAARELGLSASEVESRLAAVPGIDARRDALARARDLISSRPPLTPADEDQLVAVAMPGDDLAAARDRRTSRERGWRVLVATGSVAAAIAVIVGVASMKPASDSKFSQAASAPALDRPAESDSAKTPGVEASRRVNLGDVTQEDALTSAARAALADQPPAASPSDLPQSYTTRKNADPLTPTLGAEDHQQANDLGAFSAAGLPACTPAALKRNRLTTSPTLIAGGTVAGAPVAVLIYDNAGTDYAEIVRVSDCSLIRRQPLG